MLPMAEHKLAPRSPGPYEQAGLRDLVRETTGVWVNSSGTLEFTEGTSQPGDVQSTRLENVRPWTLRQWSQKSLGSSGSLWPRPPSASLMASADEFVRPERPEDGARYLDEDELSGPGGDYLGAAEPSSDIAGADELDVAPRVRVCGRVRSNANGGATEPPLAVDIAKSSEGREPRALAVGAAAG